MKNTLQEPLEQDNGHGKLYYNLVPEDQALQYPSFGSLPLLALQTDYILSDKLMLKEARRKMSSKIASVEFSI